MLKLIRSILAKRSVITLIYTNSRADRVKIRRALAEGFRSAWNGAVWILTKIVYL